MLCKEDCQLRLVAFSGHASVALIVHRRDVLTDQK